MYGDGVRLDEQVVFVFIVLNFVDQSAIYEIFRDRAINIIITNKKTGFYQLGM